MIDHDKLKEAIKRANESIQPMSLVKDFRLIIAAAESTLPKTKMAEVWRVEYARHGEPVCLQYTAACDADRVVEDMRGKSYIACIRVTGPHQQEVPA